MYAQPQGAANGVSGGAGQTTTEPCNSGIRQVLTQIDDSGPITRDALTAMLQRQLCDRPGHSVSLAALHPLLEASADGATLGMSPAGGKLLLDFGAESPDWAGPAHQSALPPLRAWQSEALRAWADHGRCGTVEAVTGTGKSRLGVEAAREAVRDDFNVVVMVPTVDLVEQWERTLRRGGITSVGRRGDGRRDTFSSHDVLVATVHSLYEAPPVRPDGKVLVIADECHRYGSDQWQRALSPSYRRRLGLTATFERNDDGIDVLRAYFGGSPLYSIGFRRAIQDGVVAHYDVSLLGIDLTAEERAEYDAAHESVVEARNELISTGIPAEPFGEFMRAVQIAADGIDCNRDIEDAAHRYLKAFSRRIDIVATSRAKLKVAPMLAPWIIDSQGTLVFTRRVEATDQLSRVFREVGLDLPPVHSELTKAVRADRLSKLRSRSVKGLIAPTVLDEGIDVPEVDLGIVMSGSKNRRQMIQRMGRVLRLKKDGRSAHFVIIYARDTIEDVSKGSGEAYLDLIIDTASTVTDLEVAGSTLRATPRARTEVAAVPETRKEPELSRSPQGPVKKGTSEMSQKRKEKKVHSFDSYTPPKNKGPHRRSSEPRTNDGAATADHLPRSGWTERQDPRQTVRELVSTGKPSSTSGGGPADTEAFVGHLERLAALYGSGVLTGAEFDAAKARVLGL